MEEEKATDKQCKFMHRLGIEYNMETTKTAARLMIDAKLTEKNGDEKPEVIKIAEKIGQAVTKRMDETAEAFIKPKDNDKYEIGFRHSRSNALASAIESVDYNDEIINFWKVVKEFEKYNVTGE